MQLKKIANENELVSGRFYLIKVRVHIGLSYYLTAIYEEWVTTGMKLRTLGYYGEPYAFSDLEEVYEIIEPIDEETHPEC